MRQLVLWPDQKEKVWLPGAGEVRTEAVQSPPPLWGQVAVQGVESIVCLADATQGRNEQILMVVRAILPSECVV